MANQSNKAKNKLYGISEGLKERIAEPLRRLTMIMEDAVRNNMDEYKVDEDLDAQIPIAYMEIFTQQPRAASLSK